jgi:hypothetical protein
MIVAATPVGLHEERVRVTCNLPVNNFKEEGAFWDIVDHLKSLRSKPIGVRGFTISQMRPSAFLGYWWSAVARRWMHDRIVLVLIDLQLQFSDPSLSQEISDLKETIRNCYRECGSPQEEVWVVAHQVYRQD